MIKLDVEGSEADVLRGLRRILSGSYLKAIILEADPNLLVKTESELYRILTNAGFNIRMLTRNERSRHHLDNFIAVSN